MDNMKFIQAVSRLRALETKLLDKSKIDRLIDSSSPEEALKLLQETQYGNYMANIRRPEEYEILLSEELKRLYALMYEISPEKLIVDIMSIRYDYHNIKVLIKGKLLGKDLSYLLIPVGTVNTDSLKRCSDESNYRDLNQFMRSTFEKSLKLFEESEDPQKIDIIADKFMYEDMYSKGKETGEKSIIDYIKTNIDLTNLKAFLRIKKQNKDRNFFNEVFIENGKLDKDVFLNNFNDSIESFINKLSYTDYYNVLKSGIEDYLNTGDFNLFEKLVDNYIMTYVKDAKYVSFGAEPLIAYIYAKETEIKVIRIIMVGKLNSIAPDTIRERLRDVYV